MTTWLFQNLFPLVFWVFLFGLGVLVMIVVMKTHKPIAEGLAMPFLFFLGMFFSPSILPQDFLSETRERLGFRYDYAVKPDPARIKMEPKKLLATDPNAARWVVRVEVTPNAAKDGVPLPDLTSIYNGHVWYKDAQGRESYAVVFKEE